jgi:hypothetical protein
MCQFRKYKAGRYGRNKYGIVINRQGRICIIPAGSTYCKKIFIGDVQRIISGMNFCFPKSIIPVIIRYIVITVLIGRINGPPPILINSAFL